MPDLPIYLDNHATTRTDPRVVAAMLPFFTEVYGNAASTSHRFGRDAAAAVEASRATVAELLGAADREIVFTSGATESNNLALKGASAGQARKGKHLVSALSEHRSVLDPLRSLATRGYDVTLVPPDPQGLVSAESIAAALRPDTILVSVMTANNEVGTINPIDEIGRLCRDRGVLLHTDATQAVGKIAFNVADLPVDLVSFTAHKLYGPKGIGALYIRRQAPPIRIEPQIEGGGHERGNRSGTLPVPLIVGFGQACLLASAEHDQDAHHSLVLRNRLEGGLRSRLDHLTLHGHPTRRLPGNLNLGFQLVDGEALMLALRDIAVSSGSACTSANPEPSHVLRAMGLDEDQARASLRFGIGRFNTPEEIDFAIQAVASAVERLRLHSPAWDASRS